MEYKDRSTGLIIFGVLTLGLGCLCLLLILVILAAQAMPMPAKQPIVTLLPAMAVYGVMAIALAWLGIGSMMAKRWARALLLIFSWSWLIMGVFIMVMMAVILPSILGNLPTIPNAPEGSPPPAAVMAGAMVFAFLFDGFFFLVLPGVWTFFYGSRHVKATCEARHPQPGWTDACPLPVLAIVLWLAYSVPMMVIMPFTGLGALPFFGTFLTGLPASAANLVLGAVYFVAGWRLYRLDILGWWLIVGVMCFFLVSGFVTFMHHDIMDMYRTMNLPPDQLAQMDRMGFLKGNSMLWLTAIFSVPIFGYLIFIRRYFPAAVAT